MSILAEGNLQQLLFVAAIAIMILVLMRRSSRYFSRQNRNCSATGGLPRRKADASMPSHAPDELVRWEVHMHDVARDLAGQLDSKMVALEQLIRDADRAAARLEKAIAAGQGCFDDDQPPHEAERGEPHATDQAEKLKAPGTSDPCVCDRGRRREEIYTLSDYGLEPSEIAQRVGSPVGEVQLILGLRGGK